MKINRIAALLLLSVASLAAQGIPAASMQGKVLRLGGNQPIANARVTAQNMQTNALALATTDASGAFSVTGLTPGIYRLSFAARGFISHVYGQRVANGTWAPIDAGDGEIVKDLAVRLTPGGSIEGRVRDTQGLPAVGAPVALVRSGYNAEGKKTLTSISSVETDDRGEYRFFWIPPGRYYLRVGGPVSLSNRLNPLRLGSSDSNQLLQAYAELFYPAAPTVETAVPIEVRAGDDLQGMDLRLQPQRLLRIRGRVLDAQTGRSPAKVTIGLAGDDWSSSGGHRYNSADGGFEIAGLWPGEYKVVAMLSDQQTRVNGRPVMPVSDYTPVRLLDKDVENVNLRIVPPVSLSGRAVFEGNGSIPQGLNLRVDNIETRMTLPLPYSLAGFIAADGSFIVPQVVAGSYALGTSSPEFYVKRARYDGADVAAEPLKLAGGNGSAPLEVVLAWNVASVSVQVTDAALQPAAGARVLLVSDSGRHRRDAFKQAMTDARGEYTFSNVPPGDYKLYAWEALEAESWRDPEVLKKFDRNARAVRVAELSSQTVNVLMIPAEAP
jgi:hypothetical protein